MKTEKKNYIRPVMEVLDPEVGPLMQIETTSINVGDEGNLNGGEDILSRQNDFTFTEDSDDDW